MPVLQSAYPRPNLPYGTIGIPTSRASTSIRNTPTAYIGCTEKYVSSAESTVDFEIFAALLFEVVPQRLQGLNVPRYGIQRLPVQLEARSRPTCRFRMPSYRPVAAEHFVDLG